LCSPSPSPRSSTHRPVACLALYNTTQVCVFFQILLWNIIVCTSQDMMAFYFVYGNHWMGYFCQDLVDVETVNIVQFLFDHLVG